MVQVSLHMQPALVIAVVKCAIGGQKCNLIGRKVTWLGWAAVALHTLG